VDVLIVSAALDTNGQNARYVRAAEKYQSLAVGNTDPAGVVARFQAAAEKHGGIRIRSAHRANPYMDFPCDILWDRRTDSQVRRLAVQADLLHLNNSFRPYQLLMSRKPALLHHHGSLFRRDPEMMLKRAAQRGFVQAVSTIDLTRPDPRRLHWLPTAYDLDDLALTRQRYKRAPDGKVRIVSAPTNRDLKSTAALEAAVARLQEDGLPVELLLIEGQRWADCMAQKATADILFDQTLFGYGCNAVEAWGMDIPVIAGADEWTLAEMRKRWGGLPFYETTEDGLVDALRAMVESPDLRAEWAERGSEHVQRYHAELPALTRLVELYEKTLQAKKGRPLLAKPTTFENTKRRHIFIEGVQLAWDPAGRLTTRDPVVIERLRAFRPTFGIREVA
jgi:hypothetical protein